MKNDNFDWLYLKKNYGERFAHMFRDMFPTILEKEGALSKIISEHFDKNFSLYEDTAFVKSFGEIEKIEIQSKKSNKKILVTPKVGDTIEIDVCGADIVGYKNLNATRLDDDFMRYNTKLQYLEMPNLEQVGANFLLFNKLLDKIDFPKLEYVDDNFLAQNRNITAVDLPELKYAGNNFLKENEKINRLSVPNLKNVVQILCLKIEDSHI